jgi:N-methylhydantoinase B/oxoprolinase/acetone carboxylase alpha subunit
MTVVSPAGEREAEHGYALLDAEDETAVVVVSGGGGFGEPAGRDPARRARDRRLGYVLDPTDQTGAALNARPE